MLLYNVCYQNQIDSANKTALDYTQHLILCSCGCIIHRSFQILRQLTINSSSVYIFIHWTSSSNSFFKYDLNAIKVGTDPAHRISHMKCFMCSIKKKHLKHLSLIRCISINSHGLVLSKSIVWPICPIKLKQARRNGFVILQWKKRCLSVSGSALQNVHRLLTSFMYLEILLLTGRQPLTSWNCNHLILLLKLIFFVYI